MGIYESWIAETAIVISYFLELHQNIILVNDISFIDAECSVMYVSGAGRLSIYVCSLRTCPELQSVLPNRHTIQR